MNKLSFVVAVSSLIILLISPVAQAAEIALNFELPPSRQAEPQEQGTEAKIIPETDLNETDLPAAVGPKPLPIPRGAGSPPMRSHSPQQLPAGVYRQAVAASINAGNSPAAVLPPAPPVYGPAPSLAQQAVPEKDADAPPEAKDRQDFAPEPVALTFDIAPSSDIQVAQSPPAPVPKLPADPLPGLFDGGTDSLVARAVGSAEGTRTPDGGKTYAYAGHRDPGNGVWNMGTFSYQHGAKTPAEADQKQLSRLQNQSQVLKRRAISHDINLTLEETLNGIDLANQSPLAAIGRVGYIERLVEARNMGYTGFESIVVARTRSYINPDTQRWNAPGLGNTLESITRDQRRRANAVARAMELYQQENPDIAWEHWALMPSAESLMAVQAPAQAEVLAKEKPEDIIFSLWTDNSDPAPQTRAMEQKTEDKANAAGRNEAPQPSSTVAITGLPQSPTAPAGREAPPEGKPGDLSASNHQRPDSSPPTWVETREKNQTLNQKAQAMAKSENLTVEKVMSSPLESQAEAGTSLPAGDNSESGAAPETRVLSPLTEDNAPFSLPGLSGPEAVAPTALLEKAKTSPKPSLPEGLLQTLQQQVTFQDQEREKEAADEAPVLSEQEQMTEQMFKIDIPMLPVLD